LRKETFLYLSLLMLEEGNSTGAPAMNNCPFPEGKWIDTVWALIHRGLFDFMLRHMFCIPQYTFESCSPICTGIQLSPNQFNKFDF